MVYNRSYMTAALMWRHRPARKLRQAYLWLAVVAILLYFFLAIGSLVGDSPTMDEQNHIARGLAFLRTGDPRLSLEHPPLINSLSALPLLTMPELRLPTDHPSWERREGWYEFADLFMWQYNHQVTRIVFLARIPIVFLAIALALAGFRFAHSLWGQAAALPALVLFLFEPNLMAHGRYATTDMGGVVFTFLATYSLWRLWQTSEEWDWRRWLISAVLMGLAFGSKTSALGFVLIWFFLALLPLFPTNRGQHARQTVRRITQLISAGMVSVAVVWIIFGFEWGNYKFYTEALAPLNRWMGPMPTFWAGMEQIMLLGGGRATSFLFGRFSDSGWAGYFPAAFAMKTPLVLIALVLIALILLLKIEPTRRRALFLIIMVFGFYLIAAQSALNIGYRHVLPALPYLLLIACGLAAPELQASSSRLLSPSAWLAAGLLVLVVIALWFYPNYLSYFNPAVGGPANGFRLLTDSNVDWGQDLLRLKDWMSDNGVASVRLGWFGTADPAYYGLSHEPLPGLGRDQYFRLWWDPPFTPESPEPGVYAISASSIWEPPLREEEKRIYAWFRAREPDDRVGYSILIYEVR